VLHQQPRGLGGYGSHGHAPPPNTEGVFEVGAFEVGLLERTRGWRKFFFVDFLSLCCKTAALVGRGRVACGIQRTALMPALAYCGGRGAGAGGTACRAWTQAYKERALHAGPRSAVFCIPKQLDLLFS
jgi:hypothetical protein